MQDAEEEKANHIAQFRDIAEKIARLNAAQRPLLEEDQNFKRLINDFSDSKEQAMVCD